MLVANKRRKALDIQRVCAGAAIVALGRMFRVAGDHRCLSSRLSSAASSWADIACSWFANQERARPRTLSLSAGGGWDGSAQRSYTLPTMGLMARFTRHSCIVEVWS